MSAWLALSLPVSAAALVDAIVTDPLTGVALEGYDAVSYFTGPEPVQGLADYEYQWGGVPWYFASAANRDVFMRNPEIYAPQFGGHCATSLSRGYLSDGKPRLYAISGMKLYLFYSMANRDAFFKSEETSLQQANGGWARLKGTLTGEEGSMADAVGKAAAAEAEPEGEAAAH
ncbi:YHS domain-containing (seleno)protein [Devosia sp.]|uniref:YHS domain-containing (seleno)protein n=1 Tax=Devosia sp. TaxID=1871048 RepID=UPI003F72C0F4